MNAVSTASSITADADLALLKPIRNHVKKVARSLGADEDTIGDFELAVSELVTNVIEHTDDESITMIFQSENDQWILDVSGADDLDDPGDLRGSRPSTTALDGRGLFITQAVMDSVELVDIEQRRYIRCIKAIA